MSEIPEYRLWDIPSVMIEAVRNIVVKGIPYRFFIVTDDEGIRDTINKIIVGTKVQVIFFTTKEVILNG